MKQVLKDKLKELAILCLDNGINFETHHFYDDDYLAWFVAFYSDGKLNRLSKASEPCADWIEDSEERIDLCIKRIKEFER